MKIEMYTKLGCVYCVRARKLLRDNGLAFEDHDVTMPGPRATEMRERAPHHTTVPSIFIDYKHIGGFDDLEARAAIGRLDA